MASPISEQLIRTVNNLIIRLTVDAQWFRQEPVPDRSSIAPLSYTVQMSPRQQSFTVKLTGIPFHNGNKTHEISQSEVSVTIW